MQDQVPVNVARIAATRLRRPRQVGGAMCTSSINVYSYLNQSHSHAISSCRHLSGRLVLRFRILKREHLVVELEARLDLLKGQDRLARHGVRYLDPHGPANPVNLLKI